MPLEDACCPAPANVGKYVNSAEGPLFSKNRMVFALDVARQAIAERGAAVVTEGYADCIMAHQFGITNAVATLGTALTENHVSALSRFTRKVILVFDGDKAGKEAAEKSLPRFLSQEIDLRILTLTSAKDPADFLVAHGAAAFNELIETAAEAWEYKLRLCIERIGLATVDAASGSWRRCWGSFGKHRFWGHVAGKPRFKSPGVPGGTCRIANSGNACLRPAQIDRGLADLGGNFQKHSAARPDGRCFWRFQGDGSGSDTIRGLAA